MALESDYKSEVLAATDLVELVGKTVALKKVGSKYLALCPFHSEKTPSFNVDPVKRFFHCFGCKAKGNAIDFVMQRDRVSFLEAMRQLGDAAGIVRPEGGVDKKKAGERQQLLDANSAAGQFFVKLFQHPATGEGARNYMAERKFTPEVLQQFGVGFAADAWDALLKSPLMRTFPPPLLATAGLLKPRDQGGGYYDTFRNRVIFPIRDENGRVIAFGGRVMPGSQDKAKYLNSPETPLFSKSRSLFGLDLARQKIVESRTVAIVEGYTDVVMAHQYGATNVVSVLGTALTESHVTMLRRFADRIVLLFDPDTAGDTAVNRAVELFLRQPIEIAIAALPDELDPDEFLIAHGAEAFDAVLKQAADALTYKWRQLSRQFNKSGSDLTGQQKAVEEYLAVLASARGAGPVDSLRWGASLARVSRLTDIPMEQLNQRFKAKRPPPRGTRSPGSGGPNRNGPKSGGANGPSGPNGSRGPSDVPGSDGPDGTAGPSQADGSAGPINSAGVVKMRGPLMARDYSERWILGVLLLHPHWWMEVVKTLGPADFTDETRRLLAEKYWERQRDEGEPVFNEFLSELSPDLANLAVELIEELNQWPDADAKLNEALAFFSEMRHRAERDKQAGALRRINDVQNPAPDGANHPLRLLMEKAKRPDLRKSGRM